jgi:hypothetical protein
MPFPRPAVAFKAVWRGSVVLGTLLCLALMVTGDALYGLSALGAIAAVWGPMLALTGAGVCWGVRRLAGL